LQFHSQPKQLNNRSNFSRNRTIDSVIVDLPALKIKGTKQNTQDVSSMMRYAESSVYIETVNEPVNLDFTLTSIANESTIQFR
jgi:hypothetical protein